MRVGLIQALGLMFNFSSFVPSEPNLAKAGGLLLAELAAFMVASIALSELEIAGVDNVLFVGLFLFNVVPAWYLARAAKAKGRRFVFYGLFSLIPAGALFSFFILRSEEYFAQ